MNSNNKKQNNNNNNNIPDHMYHAAGRLQPRNHSNRMAGLAPGHQRIRRRHVPSLSIPSLRLLLGIALARTSVAQKALRFTTPSTNAVTALGTGTKCPLGSNIPNWRETNFDRTTLDIWQGLLDSGMVVTEMLAANYTQDRMSYAWEAGRIDREALAYPFCFVFSARDRGAGGDEGECGEGGGLSLVFAQDSCLCCDVERAQ